MRHAALIPARLGSQRLPGKNLKQIDGRSLVQIAVDTAIEAGVFDQVCVSSDSEKMRVANADFLLRPAWLGGPEASSIDVVRHFTRTFGDHPADGSSGLYDVVTLLQPTSPLRTAEDIRGALLAMRNGDGVISVTEAHPEVYTMGLFGRLRSGVLPVGPRLVTANGAIYAMTVKAILAGETWWDAGVVYGYEMPAARSVDIDTEADLELARTLWTRK